jgi:CDGSH-type Zn-finger protein/uncharacterized Fe-S cluster protein YjdI
MSGVERVQGKSLVLVFEAGKCIHSRQCVLSRPDVFVPNVEGEWIHPDNATPEEIAALAQNCPSGAISYERLDGGKAETAPLVNVARVRQDGPLAFSADLEIDGEAPRLRATLCRCGASKLKPYCDGSHVKSGFLATGEPSLVEEPKPLPGRNGKLKVSPSKDGPLMIRGNLEIVSGTGHTVNLVTKCALCRCGRSRNKPYCDGTHAEIGFTSD